VGLIDKAHAQESLPIQLRAPQRILFLFTLQLYQIVSHNLCASGAIIVFSLTSPFFLSNSTRAITNSLFTQGGHALCSHLINKTHNPWLF
jgi:hypothetical protein